MIQDFKNLPIRDSAIVYKAGLEQVQKLYEKDPMLAGELAISLLELSLKGDISSDDFTIDLLLQDTRYLVKKSNGKYDRSIEAKRQKAISEMKLAEIAAMHKQGASQQTIADTLGETQQTISYRLKRIVEDYSELL